jgi:tetratricopeptide (TPR) repeat protein
MSSSLSSSPPPPPAPPLPPGQPPIPVSAPPTMDRAMNPGNSGIGSDIVVVKSDENSGTRVRKLCTGRTFGSKWQQRSVRVVEPSQGILVLQYSKNDKDFDKARSNKIKQHNLAHPGFKELTEDALLHTNNLSEDANFCLEFHMEDGNRKGHGRALVLRFDTQDQMEHWENSIRARFGSPGMEEPDENKQFDRVESNYNVKDSPSSNSGSGSASASDSDSGSEEDVGSYDEDEDEDADADEDNDVSRPPPPPLPPGGPSVETTANTKTLGKKDKEGKTEEYDPKIHLKKSEVAKQITFSGLKNHQVDIDVLTEEAVDALDISVDTEWEYVHRDALLRWIENKKEEKAQASATVAQMPVPTEESSIKHEQVMRRHLSGLTPDVLSAIQSPSNIHLNHVTTNTDVRTTQEKRELFPSAANKQKELHNRVGTMYTLSAIQDVTTAAAEKEAVKLGINVEKLSTFGIASAESMAILYEDDDELGDNWNEKFLQAHEMNIQKHHDAMIKGKKMYDLNQKMAKLASIAARTIVDEFALPAKLKKIKPLEWHTGSEDSLASSSALGTSKTDERLSVEMEDGMENDVLYTYQGMLIRVVGINSVLEDAMTSRKVTGHEVRGMNIFQEASTTIKQEMVAAHQRQLNSDGYMSIETSNMKIPEVHTTQAFVVDYTGFRLLVTTIPPIDEEYTLQYGRIDPQDPNSDFTDHNVTLRRLLSAINNELNLKDHKIITDGAAKKIPLGSEIQGHECSDGRYYAVNMSRLMPPDLPEGGSDVTTKLLRSELVQSYSTSLSSDSFSSIICRPQNEASIALLNDAELCDVDCGNASRYLRTVRIPEFVAMLDTLSLFPYESHTLTKAMHAHGINVRHLGTMIRLTKLPHIEDLCLCEMIARTAKDILNENQRKQIIDSHRHVMQLVSDLSKQGRHLNDDAMAQLLEYNVAVTDDANRNVIDYFNLILGSSSSMENNLFWKNVLVPRMSEKFGVQCVASSLEATEAQQTSSNLSSSSASSASSSSSASSASSVPPPLLVTRSTTNANQLFHALQFHCGVRFVSSEHYQFDASPRPFTEASQLLETFPKVKAYTNRSLEANRVAEAAEIYRDSDQLDIALVAFKLRAQANKNQDAPAKKIEFALANNEIANVYRLMANKVEAHDLVYVHDSKKASSKRMLQEGLEYTKLALSIVPHTHAVASRIYETRMKIYSDMKELQLMTISFGMAIKAALSHYGDAGHHPLIAELHCMYGSLVSEHGGLDNIEMGRKNLEKARKLASRIMGARHPLLSTYASELARVDLMAGDTHAALEHYQQALLLIQSSVGMHSLEASQLYYEMAKIKQMHSHSLGQIEAEEALILAEKALSIRETSALKNVGEGRKEEKEEGTKEEGTKKEGTAAPTKKNRDLQKAMEMSTNVHIVGSTIKGSINDMLVHSYRQVAEMAADERQYERAMVCYERLVICLRTRTQKTEVTVQLLQKATREIINIKMIELKPSVAEKVSVF